MHKHYKEYQFKIYMKAFWFLLHLLMIESPHSLSVLKSMQTLVWILDSVLMKVLDMC